MKIGVLTDLHLGLVQYGLKEREEDFYKQYQKTIDFFIKSDTDIVIIGGDIFDKPRPSPKALEVFTNGLNTLIDNDIRVCNVIGNHAMIQSPDFVTADEFIFSVLNSPDKYTLLDENCSVEMEDVVIMGLPFHHNYEIDDFVKKINYMNDSLDPKKNNILVVHQAFKEFCGFSGEELSIYDIDTSNFNLIICGHIHEKKIFELKHGIVFLQPGSIERSNIAEARDEENDGKGVFLINSHNLDIDSISNSFVRLRSERKFLLGDFYLNKEDSVEDIKREILSSIKDYEVKPILFLTVHDNSRSFQQLLDLTKDLNKKCLTVRFQYFDESINENDKSSFSDNGEIPNPRDALKIALNPLSSAEFKLGLDLYDALSKGNDAQLILDNFLEKEYSKEKLTEDFLKDVEEFEKFFKRK